MAKKENKQEDSEELSKQVNLRLSETQFTNWKNYAKDMGFKTSFGAFIRFIVDERIDGTYARRVNSNHQLEKKQEIREKDHRMEELMFEQTKILEKIAEKLASENKLESNPLREFQENMIVKLIEEKERSEPELLKYFDDIEEAQILAILNTLVKANIIKLENNKYWSV